MLTVMQFDDADLREFMNIWNDEFHEEISIDEARHRASQLMELYALLVLPSPNTSPPTQEDSLTHDKK